MLLLGTFALAVSTTSFGLSKVFWGLVVRCDAVSHYQLMHILILVSLSSVDVYSPHSTAMQVNNFKIDLQNFIHDI